MTMNTTTLESIAKADMVTPTTLNGLPGMSSQEVAEITGKRHDHVLRDIRKMLGALGLINGSKSGSVNAPISGEVKFADAQYRDAKGELRPLVVLDKELTFTLLSRYSFELSNLIVKRWLELEGSGFARVSVHAAVVHLVEREKDTRRAALKALKKGPTHPLTAEQRERRKVGRMHAKEARKARQQGWEWC
ncbi:Phage regulatory protein Rha [compost metagenome]